MSRRHGTRRASRGSTSRDSDIDIAAIGTFSRALEASYVTATPANGVTFMAWAAADVPVFENGRLRIERASTNFLLQSRTPSDAAIWTQNNLGAVTTANYAAGPDGSAVAHRFQASGTQYSRGQTVTGPTNPHCVSSWGRGTSGPSKWTADYGVAIYQLSALDVWTRGSYLRTGGTGNFHVANSAYGAAATPQDIIADLHQVESGRYPTSAIRTTVATVTRPPDSLTIAQAALPTALWSKCYRISQVQPIFASVTDVISADVRWLFTIGGSSNGIRLRHNGSAVVCEAVQGGTVRATSPTLTFARDGLLGAVSWDPQVGTVSIDGVAGVVGSPWAWTPGDVRIGGIYGGSGSELDGRISPYLERL